MKIRGESGGVPARMGGGAGAASRGGSVKVIKAMSKRDRDFKNKGAEINAKAYKSGEAVKAGEKLQKVMKPAKVVKINSAPAKSADAAKKAADAKALKAANKGKKK